MNSTVDDGSRESQELKPLPWVQQLFQNSPLKKEKFARVRAFLPVELKGLRLLDVGGDNGVISYKLRELGGEWSSVDLIDEAVISIKKVVGERVYKMEEDHLPFDDSYFDCVAIVDMLEHLPNDRAFLGEVTRVLKPVGTLIVNVPNPKEGLLRAFRNWIGQTDEKHGHVRPGYSEEDLSSLLGDGYEIVHSTSYSRLCAQLVDTFVNGALSLLKAGKKGKKGTLVTSDTLESSGKRKLALSIIGPFLSFAVFVDRILPFTHGSMLIVKTKKLQ